MNEVYLSAGDDGSLHAEDGAGNPVDLTSLSRRIVHLVVVSHDMICLEMGKGMPLHHAAPGDGS